MLIHFFGRRIQHFLKNGLKTAAMRFHSRLFSQQKEPLGPHRLHQRADAQYLHHALQIIREHMQAQLGCDLL
jgi:hypothetical protein